jgi:hypothetical protein
MRVPPGMPLVTRRDTLSPRSQCHAGEPRGGESTSRLNQSAPRPEGNERATTPFFVRGWVSAWWIRNHQRPRPW